MLSENNNILRSNFGLSPFVTCCIIRILRTILLELFTFPVFKGFDHLNKATGLKTIIFQNVFKIQQ